MTAVNLIPREHRAGRLSVSTSPQTIGLLAGLAAALVAALLFVSAANSVSARQSELAKLSASATSWKAVASDFAPYVSVSHQRAAALATVRQLASGRFPWPRVLEQIAQLMPADAALSSLQAASAAASGSSTATPASASTSTSTSSLPTFQLSGCATSQSAVAQTMQRLRGVDGGSTVTLSSSTNSSTSASTSGSASSTAHTSGSGGCAYPVVFTMSLTLTGATNTSTTASGAPGASGTASVSTSTTATTTAQAQ